MKRLITLLLLLATFLFTEVSAWAQHSFRPRPTTFLPVATSTQRELEAVDLMKAIMIRAKKERMEVLREIQLSIQELEQQYAGPAVIEQSAQEVPQEEGTPPKVVVQEAAPQQREQQYVPPVGLTTDKSKEFLGAQASKEFLDAQAAGRDFNVQEQDQSGKFLPTGGGLAALVGAFCVGIALAVTSGPPTEAHSQVNLEALMEEIQNFNLPSSLDNEKNVDTDTINAAPPPSKLLPTTNDATP